MATQPLSIPSPASNKSVASSLAPSAALHGLSGTRPTPQSVDWSSMGTGLRHSLWAVAALAVARFLGPAELGLAALALLAVNLFAVAHRAVAAPLVGQRHLPVVQAAGRFWITALTGAAALVLLLTFGSTVAQIFNAPSLALILPMAGLITLLDAIGAVPAAILERERRYSTLAISQVIAGIAGFTFALALASNGAGAWSLIYGRLLAGALELSLLWWHAPVPLAVRPQFRLSPSPAPAPDVLAGVASFAGRHSDKVLLATGLGTAALGAYQLAFDLATYPLALLGQWMSAVLCPSTELDHSAFQSQFLAAARATALLTFPLAAMLAGAVVNPSLVNSLLGPAWNALGSQGLAPLLLSFAALSALVPVFRLAEVAFRVTRRPEVALQWSVVSVVITVVAAAFALPWGARGVALAVSVSTIAVMVPALHQALALVGISSSDFARALFTPTLAALACGLFTFTWLHELGVIAGSASLQLVVAAAISLTFYLGLLRTLRPQGLPELGLAVAQLPSPLASLGLALLGLQQPATVAGFSR